MGHDNAGYSPPPQQGYPEYPMVGGITSDGQLYPQQAALHDEDVGPQITADIDRYTHTHTLTVAYYDVCMYVYQPIFL